jgi:hypothetical protein
MVGPGQRAKAGRLEERPDPLAEVDAYVTSLREPVALGRCSGCGVWSSVREGENQQRRPREMVTMGARTARVDRRSMLKRAPVIAAAMTSAGWPR